MLSTSQKSDSLYQGKCKLLSYLHFPGYNDSDFDEDKFYISKYLQWRLKNDFKHDHA